MTENARLIVVLVSRYSLAFTAYLFLERMENTLKIFLGLNGCRISIVENEFTVRVWKISSVE